MRFSVNVLIQRLRLKSQSFQFSSISSSSTFSRKQPENTQRATNESKKNTDDNRMINRTSIGCYPPFLSMSYLKIPTLWGDRPLRSNPHRHLLRTNHLIWQTQAQWWNVPWTFNDLSTGAVHHDCFEMILCLERNGSFHIKYILPSSYLTWIPWEYPRILLRIRSRDFVSQTHGHHDSADLAENSRGPAARSVIFASALGQPSNVAFLLFPQPILAEKNDNKLSFYRKFEVRCWKN